METWHGIKFEFNYKSVIFPILMVINIKDRLQSLLRIQSAHNKCGPHCPNFAFLKTFLN